MTSLSRPHFGTDGVRGTYGENLTLKFVYLLGQSIAECLGVDIEFVIGRDTRSSGPTLEKALIAGLESKSAKVRDIGIISTPGVAFIARRDLVRACVLTASHNPAGDNGVKVFDVGGVKIDAEVEKRIEDELDELYASGGDIEHDFDSDELKTSEVETKDYVSYLLDALQGVSLEGLKIVLDCANGAAFNIAPAVFLLAGAQVVAINTESDGLNINENCGATNLSDLKQQVLIHRADIGFAFDGDADRVMVVDDKGHIRDGDSIIALFAIDMASRSQLENNTVVATQMSNGALKSFLEKNGISLVETNVGDKYVLEEMLSNNFSLGGEQSGHIIRTDYAIWGDGILNALLVSKIFKEIADLGPKVSTSQMFSLFTPRLQLHEKVKVVNKSNAVNNKALLAAIDQEKKGLGDDSRVIVRPSGTEEVVRITVEGLIENSLKESIQRLSDVIREVCK